MVRATVPNPDYELRPGMFVNANLLGAKRPNAVLVPQKAVIQTGNQQMVMVVNDKNIIEQKVVIVGEWIGDQWIIKKGLQDKETVIVEGTQKVRPGMTVKAVPYKAPAAPPKTKADVCPPSKNRAVTSGQTAG